MPIVCNNLSDILVNYFSFCMFNIILKGIKGMISGVSSEGGVRVLLEVFI